MRFASNSELFEFVCQDNNFAADTSGRNEGVRGSHQCRLFRKAGGKGLMKFVRFLFCLLIALAVAIPALLRKAIR